MARSLKDAGYISLNTMAVVLEFAVVNREINVITSSRFACEFSTSGYVISSFRMRSSKLSNWNERHDAVLLSPAVTILRVLHSCFRMDPQYVRACAYH